MRLFFCLFLVSGVFAGETGRRDSVALVLPEVVVTAERLPRRVNEVAATVSVVEKDDIVIARTATDALATLPGVFVQRTGQFGRTDVDIRGMGAQGTQIAVLVDGRPEKMSLFGCTITHTLPLNNVERIEVVRGPLSVLYGSDALGGVINIITRQAKRPLDLNAMLSYGSFNTFQARASVGTRQGRWHGLVSFDKALSEGHLPNSRYNGNDVAVRAGYDLSSRVKVDFTGKFFTGVKHEPKRTTDPDTLVATGWNQYTRGGVDINMTLGFNGGEGLLKVYRTMGEHQFDPKDGWHSTDYTNGALLHLHRQFQFGNVLQGGVEIKQLAGTWIKSEEDKPSWSRTQLDLFLQDEQRLGRLILNGGARFARDNISGNVFCPRAGVVLHLFRQTALRAGVNRGFRYPPFNYTSIFPPSNPQLRPEVSWNYEVGVNQVLDGWLTLDGAVFYITGEDLIELADNPAPPPLMRFVNKGEWTFKGVEAAIAVQPDAFYYLKFAGTVTDFGVHTRGRPGIKLDASAGINRKKGGGIGEGKRGIKERVFADLLVHYAGRYYAADSAKEELPAYWTVDLRVGVRLARSLSLFAAVENIFDHRYEVFANLPGTAAGRYLMPGRSFTVGVDISE